MPPSVSVIIPAYNEERTLPATLDAITSQDYQDYEIVVVDDGSTDRTPELAESYDNVRLIQSETNEGLSGSLNDGMEATDGEIICSLHADCEPKDDDWLSDMAGCIESDAGVVTCMNAIKEERSQAVNMFQKILDIGHREPDIEPPNTCEPANGFDDKGDLYRREAIEQIGGFGSEKFFRAGEDIYLRIRLANAGWRFRVAPTYIYHNHGSNQEDFGDFLRKNLEYSEAKGANKRIHGSDHEIGWWNEATKTLLYGLAVIPQTAIAGVSLVVAKLLYQIWTKRHDEYGLAILVLPFVLAVADLMNIVGFWKGYLTGQQTW